jgi:hypothetical protein
MDFRQERIFKGPGFAETLYLGTSGSRRVIRKISNPDSLHFSRIALAREIRLLCSLPQELKQCFPPVLNTNLKEMEKDPPEETSCIFYDMPYYAPEEGWATLSRCILEGSMDIPEARRVMGEILDTAFRYFRMDERKPSGDYAEKTMINAMRESIAWANNQNDFNPLTNAKNLTINSRKVPDLSEIDELLSSTRIRTLLTPYRDRFLHGDFFPENILYNTRTGQWILLDPVSVRGVHRGDFILDLNKMGDWLSGELPALRMGMFSVEFSENKAEFSINKHAVEFENLNNLRLSEWYRERLSDSDSSSLFTEEKGWERRWIFIKAFYSFSMVPLADKTQSIARYLLGLQCMSEFMEKINQRE